MKKVLFTALLVALIAFVFVKVKTSNADASDNTSVIVGTEVNLSADNEPVVTEERNVGVFESISVEGSFDTYYVQSDEYKLVIEGSQETVGKLITKIRDNDDLIVKFPKGMTKNPKVKITVYAPRIDDFSIAGSGNLYCGNVDMPASDIELDSAGSGNIFADSIVCREIDIELAGSCGVDIKNVTLAEDLDIEIAGSGNVKVNGSCRNVEIEIAGSGSVSGNLQYGKLKKRIAGSGRINL